MAGIFGLEESTLCILRPASRLCSTCSGSDFVEEEDGSLCCTNCGTVAAERMIAFDEKDYRTFGNDDDEGREHYGGKELLSGEMSLAATGLRLDFNPGKAPSSKALFSMKTLSRVQNERKDEDFLREGLGALQHVIQSHTRGTTFDESLWRRARKIFSMAFKKMVDQKSGTDKMEKTGKNREKLARWRTFIVAAVWKAGQDDPTVSSQWTLNHVNSLFGGKPVSKLSVKNALKFIGIW